MQNAVFFAIVLILNFFSQQHCLGAELKPKKPHVILISLDTVSAKHMNLYGYQRETMPFVKTFARENVTFEKATAQGAYTLPSHFSMFTGVFPQTHKVEKEFDRNILSPEIWTIGQYYKNAGYRTYYSVTDLMHRHLSVERGLARGFDFLNSYYEIANLYNQQSVESFRQFFRFIKSQNEPTFMFFHTYAAHTPYSPFPPFDRYFVDDEWKKNTLDNGLDIIELTSEVAQRLCESDAVPKMIESAYDLKDPKDLNHLRSLYDGGLRTLDRNLHRFFTLLKKEGLYDNSIIILTSDHGELFGEHDRYGHADPFEVGLHIPLIMKIPGQAAMWIKEPVLSIDILPTVLDLSKIPIRKNVEGRSLLPLLKGNKIEPKQFVLARGFKSESISDGHWKLFSYRYKSRDNQRWEEPKQLYNLDRDPGETKDVAAQFPKEVTRLSAALSASKASHIENLVYPPKEQLQKKLYWFIPDGTRADRGDFNIFKWAQEGKLPHLKRLMDEGTYGYSIPDFPSHTPINFASLLTGTHPARHGIADGPMHAAGAPLSAPSVNGFSSASKRVAPIWKIFDGLNRKIMLLSVPGSTPPEIGATTVRGRWGGWGADTFNLIFESKGLLPKRKQNGRAFRLFFLGAPLTNFVEMEVAPDGKSVGVLAGHGLDIPVMWNANKPKELEFKVGGQSITLQEGKWSTWRPVELSFKDIKFNSHVRIKLIKLWADGNFRVRVLYDNLNRLIAQPGEAAEILEAGLGPMVDHPDNWPPQLIFEKEDKQVFMDEMRMSLNWHRRAVPFIIDEFEPDLFIHDTYTPNQMLESPWWHTRIDKTRKGYSPVQAAAAWKDILEMYKGLDDVLGEAIKKADMNTVIAFSSDHGVCPLHRMVHLNNLFAKKGWLKFTTDPVNGEATIDWKNTKVIYLKMLHVYINPNGLDGDWRRASGSEYEKLRRDVLKAIQELKDSDGTRPLVRAVNWEEAGKVFELPEDRVGDLVLEVKPPYFWYEEVDASLRMFSDSLTSGYKQSLDPKMNECMWTPFVVWGPGVRPNHYLSKPISHVDQLPTLLKLLDIPIPEGVQGKVLDEALE